MHLVVCTSALPSAVSAYLAATSSFLLSDLMPSSVISTTAVSVDFIAAL